MKFVIKRVLSTVLVVAAVSGCAAGNSGPSVDTLIQDAEAERTKTGPLSDAYLTKVVAVGDARIKSNAFEDAQNDFTTLYNTTPTSKTTLYKGIAAAKLAHLLLMQDRFREAAPLGKEAVQLLPADQKERRVEAYHDLALCYWTVADQRDIRPFADRGTEFARDCINIDLPTSSEYYPLKAEITKMLQEREHPQSKE